MLSVSSTALVVAVLPNLVDYFVLYLIMKYLHVHNIKSLRKHNNKIILLYIDGLAQNCSNSIADALELLQSWAKTSMYLSFCLLVVKHQELFGHIRTHRYSWSGVVDARKRTEKLEN